MLQACDTERICSGSKQNVPMLLKLQRWLIELKKLSRMPNWFTTILPSFNWTLKFREQVYEEFKSQGKDLSNYPDPSQNPLGLMDERLDDSDLATKADEYIQSFQADASKRRVSFIT